MRSFLVFLLLASSLRADPLAGAWETFSSQTSADAWSAYSYHDGLLPEVPWAGPEIDENPYAFSFFLGGEGVWFAADSLVAQGAFIGDYGAQKIAGIDASVNIDPAEIDFIDLAVYADGPRGLGYYYSLIYQPEDLGELPDWYQLTFRFDDNWFFIRGGEAIPFRPNRKFLSSILEVGIRVFPATGVAGESFVGLDDFILVPTVEGPPLSTSLSGGNFFLNFTSNPGVSATIQKLRPNFEWRNVTDQSGLTGSQSYATLVKPGAGIFRVAAEEKLTQVTSN